VSANSDDRLSVEDREALCSGICTVLTSLPGDQWVQPLNVLSRPTIDSLELVIKKANGLTTTNISINKNTNETLSSILKRGADEIRLLTTMSKTFSNIKSRNGEISDYPSLSLLRGSWPCLTFLSEKYSRYDVGSFSLFLFFILLSFFNTFLIFSDYKRSTWEFFEKFFIISGRW